MEGNNTVYKQQYAFSLLTSHFSLHILPCLASSHASHPTSQDYSAYSNTLNTHGEVFSALRSFCTNRAYLAAIEGHNWELGGVEHTYQSIGIYMYIQ